MYQEYKHDWEIWSLVQTFDRKQKLGKQVLVEDQVDVPPDALQQERELEKDKGLLYRQKILLLKDSMGDKLPACKEREQRPDMRSVRVKINKNAKPKLAKEVLPLAPQVDMAFKLAHWFVTHNQQDQRQPLKIDQLISAPTLSCYMLDSDVWRGALPKVDRFVPELNWRDLRQYSVSQQKVDQIEKGLRHSMAAGSYMHSFWAGTMHMTEEVQKVLDSPVDFQNPDEMRGAWDKIKGHVATLDSFASTTDLAMNDFTRAVATQVANFSLCRRDHQLSEKKREIKMEDVQKLRAVPFDTEDLFPGGVVKEEVEFLHGIRSRKSAENTHNLCKAAIDRKGGDNVRSQYNNAMSNRVNRGRNRNRRRNNNNNYGGNNNSYNNNSNNRGQGNYQGNQGTRGNSNSNNYNGGYNNGGANNQNQGQGQKQNQPFRGNARPQSGGRGRGGRY